MMLLPYSAHNWLVGRVIRMVQPLSVGYEPVVIYYVYIREKHQRD